MLRGLTMIGFEDQVKRIMPSNTINLQEAQLEKGSARLRFPASMRNIGPASSECASSGNKSIAALRRKRSSNLSRVSELCGAS